MNLFSDWQLFPQLRIELHSKAKIEKWVTQPNVFSLFVITEQEATKDKKNPDLAFARGVFGELRAKVLYPTQAGEGSFFVLLPQNEPRSLGHEKPGRKHVASHIGSLVAIQLLTSPFFAHKEARFCVTLSPGALSLVLPEQREFFLALYQRSVSNRIKKSESALSSKTVFFANETFRALDLAEALAVSDAMCTTRTFINMPANVLDPNSYEVFLRVLVAQENKKISGRLQIQVTSFEKLKAQGCGLLCAVGQGSDVPPRLIKLTYIPKSQNKKTKHVALVGKGITFDSGGYDIKPASGMRIMKKDMGGSAAAWGVFLACARLNLPVRLTCYLALAENMISGNAMRPGDVYTAHNGLNVEIDNTDAEGRLVLADALSIACEEKPDWLIDFATLTGAARVSLGTMVDTLFSNHSEAQQLLYKMGVETGDWVWPAPLPSDYDTYLDSGVADCINSSASGFAGSIIAALFLQKFITVPRWSHIDTYMWCDKSNGLWHEGGAPTGKCVRLVTRAIESFIS